MIPLGHHATECQFCGTGPSTTLSLDGKTLSIVPTFVTKNDDDNDDTRVATESTTTTTRMRAKSCLSTMSARAQGTIRWPYFVTIRAIG